jgi:hypothetical protein
MVEILDSFKLDGHHFKKLTTTNYVAWMPHARRILSGHHLWEHVEEEINPPEYEENKFKNHDHWILEWSRIRSNNASTSSLLWDMVSADLASSITDIHHPYTMWQTLEKQAVSSAGISSISMMAHFNNATINKGESVTGFFACLMEMRNHLRNTKHEITDDNLGGSIINTCIAIPHLTQQCIYLSKKDEMTYTKIMHSLICVDKLIEDSKTGGSNKTVVSEAHATTSFPNDKKLYCHICDRNGHSAKTCWNNCNNKKRGRQSDSEDNKATPKEKSRTKCGHCHKPGHSKEECRKQIRKEKKVTERNTTTTGDKTIIIASGNMAEVKISGNSN